MFKTSLGYRTRIRLKRKKTTEPAKSGSKALLRSLVSLQLHIQGLDRAHQAEGSTSAAQGFPLRRKSATSPAEQLRLSRFPGSDASKKVA